MIEYYAICFLNQLNQSHYLIWIISSLFFYSVYFLVYYLIGVNFLDLTWLRLLLPSPPCGRWWKTPPIKFGIIWLVRPRPHVKYKRELYPYINGSGHYFNPYWAKQLYSYLLWTTSCVEVINMYMFRRSVCNRGTRTYFLHQVENDNLCLNNPLVFLWGYICWPIYSTFYLYIFFVRSSKNIRNKITRHMENFHVVRW